MKKIKLKTKIMIANKPMSNNVGAGLDQPDIKTGRSRTTPTRYTKKFSHHINCPNNNNNRIINISRCNLKYGDGR